MCLDVQSGLYWVAGSEGPYFSWDATQQNFVEYAAQAAAAAQTEAAQTEEAAPGDAQAGEAAPDAGT